MPAPSIYAIRILNFIACAERLGKAQTYFFETRAHRFTKARSGTALYRRAAYNRQRSGYQSFSLVLRYRIALSVRNAMPSGSRSTLRHRHKFKTGTSPAD